MPLSAAVIGVCDTSTMLCKYGLNTKLDEVITKLLPKIPRADSKMSYEYPPDDVDFHYIVENKVIYMVANRRGDDERIGKRIPFTFLDDVKQKFKKEFGGSENKYVDTDALNESQCAKFNDVLRERMAFCNDKDKIKLIQKEVDEVKDIMVKNIENVIDRGDKIDTLVNNTAELETVSGQFKKNSKTLKNKMRWRNIRFIIAIVVLIIVIIGIILAIVAASGGFD